MRLKVNLVVAVAMLAALVAAVGWVNVSSSLAAEASFYDAGLSKIIRAYENGGAFIEVRDPSTGLLDSVYKADCGQGVGNPATVYASATSGLSMAYNSTAREAYVIYVAGSAQTRTCFIVSSSTPPPTYSISGTVLTNAGAPVSGVVISRSGGATTTTGTNGTYTFSGLSDGTYTVTPSLTGYTFTPTSRSVTISGQNATADFTATQSASGGADLLPTSVRGPSSYHMGQIYEVQVSLKNQGSSPAGAFRVSVYDYAGAPNTSVYPSLTENCALIVGGLAAGQSVIIKVTNCMMYNSTLHAPTRIHVFVDSKNVIAETDETNNVITQNVSVY